RLEEGEPATQAAARECWEETGWLARDVRPLVSYVPGTDIIDNPTEICVAIADRRKPRPKSRETDGSRWVPLDECLRWVRSGRIVCGMTSLALCSYVAFGRKTATLP